MLDDDRSDVESVGGVPSQSGPADCGNEKLACRGRIVEVTPGGWCSGISRDIVNQVIHLEATGCHCSASGLP